MTDDADHGDDTPENHHGSADDEEHRVTRDPEAPAEALVSDDPEPPEPSEPG